MLNIFWSADLELFLNHGVFSISKDVKLNPEHHGKLIVDCLNDEVQLKEQPGMTG